MDTKDHPTAIAVLTSAQLAELVEQAVQRALDQFVASQPPPARLLKATEMAERLSISESQLAILVREGLPFVPVGATGQRRYEADAVLAWLRRRAKDA